MSKCVASFEVGEIVVARAVADAMDRNEQFKIFVLKSLQRHMRGDWGNLCQEDKELNNLSLNGERAGQLFSVYEFSADTTKIINIITEWTREVTTILFPSDY